MRVHLGKGWVSVRVCICVYCADSDESFLSLLTSSGPNTAALDTLPSLKLFSLPHPSLSLFKNTYSFPVFPFSHPV